LAIPLRSGFLPMAHKAGNLEHGNLFCVLQEGRDVVAEFLETKVADPGLFAQPPHQLGAGIVPSAGLGVGEDPLSMFSLLVEAPEGIVENLVHGDQVILQGAALPLPCPQSEGALIETDVIPSKAENLIEAGQAVEKRQQQGLILPGYQKEPIHFLWGGDCALEPWFWHFIKIEAEVFLEILAPPGPCQQSAKLLPVPVVIDLAGAGLEICFNQGDGETIQGNVPGEVKEGAVNESLLFVSFADKPLLRQVKIFQGYIPEGEFIPTVAHGFDPLLMLLPGGQGFPLGSKPCPAINLPLVGELVAITLGAFADSWHGIRIPYFFNKGLDKIFGKW
jgi:hypothetical protein